jgi:hypothetical protein
LLVRSHVSDPGRPVSGIAFDHRPSALCAFVPLAASRGCCRKSTALLELAKQLLGKRDQPLVHIALTLKFSCQANFTRAFREATGQTPAKYLAQRRHDRRRTGGKK